jgi:hypothetical protein
MNKDVYLRAQLADFLCDLPQCRLGGEVHCAAPDRSRVPPRIADDLLERALRAVQKKSLRT